MTSPMSAIFQTARVMTQTYTCHIWLCIHYVFTFRNRVVGSMQDGAVPDCGDIARRDSPTNGSRPAFNVNR